MSIKIYLLSMIPSNCNFRFKLYYLFGCINSHQAWYVVATMEVASASFHFCLLGSKVFIFRYFYYHFVFIELVVWFDERFTTFFIYFCSIFAVFILVAFFLDYLWLWLTSNFRGF